MSISVYILQALLVGATVLLVAPRHTLFQVQVIVWIVGVAVIAVITGIEGQIRFYSNDQAIHSDIVRLLLGWTWPPETSVIDIRLPYIFPAVVLTHFGLHPALALKTVSLVCLLILSHRLLSRFSLLQICQQLRILYISGCGLIGTFFSVLALRETMMMLLAFTYLTEKSPAVRAMSILLLMLLRPHLAISLFAAELLLAVFSNLRLPRSLGFAITPILVAIGVLAGNALFSAARQNQTQGPWYFLQGFGLSEIREIASNFVGLQFLATGNWNLNFSIGSLLLLRGVFSETVIIPTLFTAVVLISGPKATRLQLTVLCAFTIYVGIATSTNFNSFRQNLPFMPLMGLAVVEYLGRWSRNSASEVPGRGSTLVVAPRGM